MFLNILLSGSFSRDPRTVFIDPRVEGDCFSSPCSISNAARVIRTADTVHFPENYKISLTSYPSEFSDLIVQLSLHNTTVHSHGTIVDGSNLAGSIGVELVSHPHYTWSVLIGWTFRNFSKPIFLRDQLWSYAPYMVFRDCTFEYCDDSIFKLAGGMFIFENCVFNHISEYPVRCEYQVHLEFVDCKFTNCKSLFIRKSDAIFTNCVFKDTFGDRGGAIYAEKSTLYVNHCFFIHTNASSNGGAIYIRDSIPKYESEITNSSFIETNAQGNGSAIFIYKSSVNLTNNCLPSKDSIHYQDSQDLSTNISYSNCEDWLNTDNIEVISDDFTPVDTFKLWKLDDLKDGTTISIEDEDELDIEL
ncbi:hypothetical protein TVAG_122440 [Trichomonas vaginalis G3]|uniref:Right handed beta helix domain-containing protein n=1 Tax=Trichomonas vaginalis (strain ATCC PRA-98 / G3) TaxID=412133 RepID=A2DN01_TRIV3|nr:pectin lyase-like family [Trichomonas vaginalis G3]EAY18178.1 hypothetical protein TVAG_122440 [Trichomonas vaginalis G3]KAI5491474.1 pectin lyase-like family [Trichomonas vaginalis G3]|eukprot:XP_001579164.1 hypothetical protein [Trichomonas vaginalis G3]